MNDDVRTIQRRVRERARVFRISTIIALIAFVSSPVIWIRFFGNNIFISVLAAIILVTVGWWLIAFLAETALHLHYKVFGISMALAGILFSHFLQSEMLASLISVITVVLGITFARKSIDLDDKLRQTLADLTLFRKMESFASRHSITTLPMFIFGHVVAFFPMLVAILFMLQISHNDGGWHLALIWIALIPIQALWLWLWVTLIIGMTTDSDDCDVCDLRTEYNEILSSALSRHGLMHEYVRDSHLEREWGYDSVVSVTVLDALHHHVYTTDPQDRNRSSKPTLLAIVESESPRISGQINAFFRPSSGLVLRPVGAMAKNRLNEAIPTLAKMLGESITLASDDDKNLVSAHKENGGR